MFSFSDVVKLKFAGFFFGLDHLILYFLLVWKCLLFGLSYLTYLQLSWNILKIVGMFWHILFIMGLQISVYVYVSIYLLFLCVIALIFQHLSQMGLGVVELHIQVSEGLMICFILRFKFLTSIFLKENTESTGIHWKWITKLIWEIQFASFLLLLSDVEKSCCLGANDLENLQRV